MLDNEPTGTDTETSATGASTSSTTSGASPTRASAATTTRRRAATRPAGPPTPATPALPADAAESGPTTTPDAPADAAGADAPPAKKAARKRATKKSAAKATAAAPEESTPVGPPDDEPATARKAAKRTRKRTTAPSAEPPIGGSDDETTSRPELTAEGAVATGSAAVLFQPPEAVEPAPRRRTAKKAAAETPDEPAGTDDAARDDAAEETEEGGSRRRRRGGRGRRGRGRTGAGEEAGAEAEDDATETREAASSPDQPASADDDDDTSEGTRRRRRRRRRGGSDDPIEDDPPNTVVRVREPRKSTRSRGGGGGGAEDDDGVRSVKGSTRLEAKKQRRREGRDAGRKRPSIITEAEFLARRESVQRTMIVRQSGERTQIAVLEDGVLVEHYVARADSGGMVGNVYLGRVQNVLPSMEAAFVDVGKGRNAVLYAGEVNWDAAGLDGQPKRIEQALKSGDSVLVQVTKDPIGHKGARLTSQVSLAGRYLVYVPNGSMTGISRKLPDTERSRLKSILKKVVPDGAGVIVRTAAEGASEEELARDVTRLSAQWEDIDKKAQKASAPVALYSEPDLTIRVVRDIFNEDFAQLIVSGDDAWDMLQGYLSHVAPDLADRVTRWTDDKDVFEANRVDEQLAKALDRKVWLPSGGYLVIDRTEAMIVVDVNTGKFTGAGGNLEETVTKNNLEAAEEIVRQLRLRDLGGIIVIDFIDMVLESNRDLVLRRLTECLGRDRTKHQVAEVTSLGLVQMTRKRVGQGLHEAFTETCEHCNGRGYLMRSEPVEARSGGSSGSGGSASGGASSGGSGERKGRGRGRGEGKSEPKAAKGARSGPKPTAPTLAAVDDPANMSDDVELDVELDVRDPGDATNVTDIVGESDLSLTADPVETGPTGEDQPEDSPVAVEDPVEPPAAEATTPRPRRRRRATG